MNAIGTRRKEHKYGVVLIRMLNLPLQLRNRMDKLLLFGIYNVKWAKAHGGVLRMLCGVDENGGADDNDRNLRTDLQRLLAGVPMSIPDDVNGGVMQIILEVHHVGWLADLLGAGGLSYFPESFSARHPCKDCWWHSSCWCAHVLPDSQEARAKRPHAAGCRGVANVPRTHDEMLAKVRTLRETKFSSKQARSDAMRDAGVSKLRCVLEHLAGAKIDEDLSADIMHQFLQGLTRHEAYWSLCDVEDCFSGKSWDVLNEARKNIDLPKGQRIPNLEKPRKDGKAFQAMSLCLSAAETMRYAVYRSCQSLLPAPNTTHGARATRTRAHIT